MQSKQKGPTFNSGMPPPPCQEISWWHTWLALLSPCIFIIFWMKVFISPTGLPVLRLSWRPGLISWNVSAGNRQTFQCTHPLTDKEAGLLPVSILLILMVRHYGDGHTCSTSMDNMLLRGEHPLHNYSFWQLTEGAVCDVVLCCCVWPFPWPKLKITSLLFFFAINLGGSSGLGRCGVCVSTYLISD